MACRPLTLIATLSLIALVLRAGAISAQQATPRPAGTPSPSDAQLDSARVIAAHAERLFDAGHFPAALAEYTRAYDALAGHPRQYFVIYNLAACNERLFHYDVALGLYEQYLRRAPETELDRLQVVAIMSTLRALLGTLVVESSVPASIWIDDRRLGTAPGRWLVPAGRHVVEARAERHEAQRQEVQLGAGQLLPLRFELALLSTKAGPPPSYFWAATTLAGASVVTGTVFGAMALSAREEGRERARASLDPSVQADRMRRYARAADIGFGAAALLGAGATLLYFVTDWPSAEPPSAKPCAAGGRPRFSLMSVGGASAALRVAF